MEKIVYGGLGLAHHEGRTLFIPYTAPGDVVEFTVTSEKKKCVFAEAAGIIEPSPLRREPECPVFGRCGGCHLLHMDYPHEIEVKKLTVLENLHRIGGIAIEPERIEVSPSRFGYRNHSIFRISADGSPGFAMRESSTVIPFPEQGCLLLPFAAREAIRKLDLSTLAPGDEVRVRIDMYGRPHFWGIEGFSAPPDLLAECGPYKFPIPPESFFQVNDLLNERLMDLTVSLPVKTARRILDLYCGVGFFTLPLSRIAGEAVGIERDRAAVKSAAAAARLNKIDNAFFKRGRAESEIYKIREAETVVADPPRSGLPDSALRGILRLRPRELIIVSCEPPTFARDTAKLAAAGYILSRLFLVDIFPGTYHVETVGLFKKA